MSISEEAEFSSGDKEVTFPGKITVSTIDLGEGTSYISETRKQARVTIQAVAVSCFLIVEFIRTSFE